WQHYRLCGFGHFIENCIAKVSNLVLHSVINGSRLEALQQTGTAVFFLHRLRSSSSPHERLTQHRLRRIGMSSGRKGVVGLILAVTVALNHRRYSVAD